MVNINKNELDLKRSSEHLHYEFGMLNALAQVMAMNITGNGVLSNAMLESFAIHVRGLVFFLFPENPKPDDVLASHFVLNVTDWENARGSKSEILKKAQSRAGKEVAHLTYERLNVTPEAKQWAFIEITNEINRVIKIFLQHAKQDLLSESWKPSIVQMGVKNET